jgi:hypothetical protein
MCPRGREEFVVEITLHLKKEYFLITDHESFKASLLDDLAAATGMWMFAAGAHIHTHTHIGMCMFLAGALSLFLSLSSRCTHPHA